MSYGFNQYANSFSGAYRSPLSQQTLALTLSIPVFQWGIGANKRRMAQNDLEASLLHLDRCRQDLEEAMRNCVLGYNHYAGLVPLAMEKFLLSQRLYAHAAAKFRAGKIAAIALSTASEDCLQAKQEMFSVVQNQFEHYYLLRHYALYDFVLGKDLATMSSPALTLSRP